MKSVTIPRSITIINNGVFYGCDSLLNVYCFAEQVPLIDYNSFSRNSNTILHVPKESVESYKTDFWWKHFFSTIIALIDEELLQGFHSEAVKPIHIQACNGQITFEGSMTDLSIIIYATNGAKVASGQLSPHVTLTLETNIQKGDIAIVKMGAKSVKVVMK